MNRKAVLLIDNSNLYKYSLMSIIVNVLDNNCDIFIYGETKYDKVNIYKKYLGNYNYKVKYKDIDEKILDDLFNKYAKKNHNYIEVATKVNIKKFIYLENCFKLVDNPEKYDAFIKLNINTFISKKINNNLKDKNLLISYFKDEINNLFFIANLEILKEIINLKDNWGRRNPINTCRTPKDLNYFNSISGMMTKYLKTKRINYSRKFKSKEGEFHSEGANIVLLKGNNYENKNYRRFKEYEIK